MIYVILLGLIFTALYNFAASHSTDAAYHFRPRLAAAFGFCIEVMGIFDCNDHRKVERSGGV